MIIGDKEDFAIEYSSADNYPKDMGYGRIWVKNKFIGAYPDLIFLAGYLLGTLFNLRVQKNYKTTYDTSLKNNFLTYSLVEKTQPRTNT